MSMTSGSSIKSRIMLDFPEKLRKSLKECENGSAILDTLLKVLGDISGDQQLALSVVELIQSICSDSSVQPSEIEFAILSLQNIFGAKIYNPDVQCKILCVMVAILLSQELSPELTSDVVRFLLQIVDSQASEQLMSWSIYLMALDCLIELELHHRGLLEPHLQSFICMLLDRGILGGKVAELVCLIVKHRNDYVCSSNVTEGLKVVLELLVDMCSLQMASVFREIMDVGPYLNDMKKELEATELELTERYESTSDLSILRTISLLQELLSKTANLSGLAVSATHPALPVARNLIALEWLATVKYEEGSFFQQFEPTPFDGADARLKKLLVLNRSLHSSQGTVAFCNHLEKLMAFAHKTKTSRSLAAVFRVLHNMLEVQLPANAMQIAVDSSIKMASLNPACLPHVVDFLKCTRQGERLSRSIILKIIDTYDEMDASAIEPHIEHLIAFYAEASTQPYEFCQPRMILHTVKRCLELKDNAILRSTRHGVAVLELCQALIRNQDYEIFQPELKAVLSLMETSHEDSDLRQRAWMLCSLIAHVNTERLKDAFDVDMDLSKIGRIENTDAPLIVIKILFDNRPDDTYLINWSLERKRSCRSIYFPLEISLAPNEIDSYTEYIGIRIDFIIDPRCGEADSIYIPILKVGQIKKTFLHLQPKLCSPITITTRAVMSTTDGRIFSSVLEEIRLGLEHIFSPLSSSKTLDELWEILRQCKVSCTSISLLPRSEKFLEELKHGLLRTFRLSDDKPNELAMVTADSLLVLMRIASVNDDWHAEFIVEDVSLLSAVHSLLSNYAGCSAMQS